MPTDTSNSSTIGEELTITGNVSSKGKVHLNGQVQGDIHCVSLVLGENARLEGNAIAKDVVFGGSLKGSIRALHVTLQSKSHVEGDVSHKSLTIEQGAYFEGKSSPSDNVMLDESITCQPGRNGAPIGVRKHRTTQGQTVSGPHPLASEGGIMH
jgi:cytoskeletal protein CcmA (bactofilin family)